MLSFEWFVFVIPNSQLNKTANSPQSYPTARDIYEIDTDHANIINDVKVINAEQEILFTKIKNRNVSFSNV